MIINRDVEFKKYEVCDGRINKNILVKRVISQAKDEAMRILYKEENKVCNPNH